MGTLPMSNDEIHEDSPPLCFVTSQSDKVDAKVEKLAAPVEINFLHSKAISCVATAMYLEEISSSVNISSLLGVFDCLPKFYSPDVTRIYQLINSVFLVLHIGYVESGRVKY
jgi:hypothetical protein